MVPRLLLEGDMKRKQASKRFGQKKRKVPSTRALLEERIINASERKNRRGKMGMK